MDIITSIIGETIFPIPTGREKVFIAKTYPAYAQKTYTLKDLPKKLKYIKDRTKKIYKDISEKELDKVLAKVTIRFRDQKEKGASNHKTGKVFITYREIDRQNLKSEKDLIAYLENPQSVITHEVTHIIQNHFNAFPESKQYTYKDKDGNWQIDYNKYVTDEGELQARIEQVVELLKWGFDKAEIVQQLYSRKHEDPELWIKIVDKAEDIFKKFGASKLPPEKDYEGRNQDQYLTRTKNEDAKYDTEDYISSGHIEDEGVNSDTLKYYRLNLKP